MKKYFALLFCIVFLCACGKKAEEAPSADSVTAAPFEYETSAEIMQVIQESETDYMEKLSKDCKSMSDSAFLDYWLQDAQAHTFLLSKELLNRFALVQYLCKELDDRNIKETNPELYREYVSQVEMLYQNYHLLLTAIINDSKYGMENYPYFDTVILRGRSQLNTDNIE